MPKALRVAATTIALVLALAPQAGSSTVVRFTNKDLCDRAEHVLHGKCASKESRFSPDGSYIYTEYTIEISERLKGDDDGKKTFTFRSLGGIVGDRGFAVSGSSTFREGEEVVAFFDRPNEKTGCRYTIGLAQGKFGVVQDALTGEKHVERDLDGLKIVDPGTKRRAEGGAERLRLKFEPFMNEIRGFLRKR